MYTWSVSAPKVIVMCCVTDLETQYPRGGKTLLYHKTKLEQYAEYLHRDGLVERLITYADTARKPEL